MLNGQHLRSNPQSPLIALWWECLRNPQQGPLIALWWGVLARVRVLPDLYRRAQVILPSDLQPQVDLSENTP